MIPITCSLLVPQLNSIDNMRVDGKFMVGNDIPEGQGSVSELLAECFELNYELRVAAEHEAEKAEKEEAKTVDGGEKVDAH